MDDQEVSDADICVELRRLIEHERVRLLASLEEVASKAAKGSEVNRCLGEAKATEFEDRMMRAKAAANARFDRMIEMVRKS